MTKTSSKSLYLRSGTSFLLSNLLNTVHVYEMWLGWCCIFQISWLNLIVFIQWWSECYCHAVETSCTVFIQIVQYSFSLTCTLYIFCVMAFSVLSSFHREGFSSSLDISERGEKRESTVHEQFCKFMFQLRYSKAAASAPNITNDIKTVTERAPGLVYIKSQ